MKVQVNKSQIETRQKANNELGIWLRDKIGELKTKGYSEAQAQMQHKAKMNQWFAEQEELDRARKGLDAIDAMSQKMGGSVGTASGHDGADTATKAIGRPPSVLDIPQSEWRGLCNAVKKRLPSYRIDTSDMNVTTKAPFGEGNFTSGTLPPFMLPSMQLDLPYEIDDAFSHFRQLTSPPHRAVEYVQHTGNTNPAAPVAELGLKPDLGPLLTTVTTPFVKIAATASLSTEVIQDYGDGAFVGWLPREMNRAIVDARTNQVINGAGGTGMLGLLNTSGTLTRAIGSDTPVDCVRKGINDIRIGSSFARADLILMHPTTHADLTLQKSTTGQYLLDPENPARLGDFNSIFGCKIVTNTYIPAGSAIVCDSQWIYAWTRQSLIIEINSYGTDSSGTNLWTNNAVSFRAEERVAMGVARPTAVNIVTGLPSN
jgi:hypothetical protein